MKSQYYYTACFCEENIWLLGQAFKADGLAIDQSSVLFITNANQQVPLFCQQSAIQPGYPVIWDYHVVLLHQAQLEQALIFDFDSELEFPVLFSSYVAQTFLTAFQYFPEIEFAIRSVPLPDYIQQFSSDRSHMLDDDQQPISPFPDYPAIQPKNVASAIKLSCYWDLNQQIAGCKIYQFTAKQCDFEVVLA